MEWANIGKQAIEREKRIVLNLFDRERWDLFFVIFAQLDIIQHRLWRFFDESDPTYPGPTDYRNIILEYYQIFDELIGDFAEACSDRTLLVVSDHGHRVRPTKTINVNECLRRRGYLVAQGKSGGLRNQLRKILLEAATRLNVEHTLIKLVVSHKKVTKVSKSLYSSSGSIDLGSSVAYLSTFAGIKSYSHGGIEINRELVSDTEYARIAAELETLLLQLTTPQGERAVTCLKRRDELEGDHAEAIYPDLLFELQEDFGVGWEVRSGLFGKAYDHNVASGGHGKAATFLLLGQHKATVRRDISIVDTAPTILDLLGVDLSPFLFDGRSIFR
jgi:predicted AlkP superfamily phosphohydrolase/phosphomutase